MLSPRWRCAFEFRHRSWYDDDILEVLRRRKIALCISDHADAPAVGRRRRHTFERARPSGRYHSSYTDAMLHRWAKAITSWRSAHRDAFVYFDNDQKAAAPADARHLMRILGM
jgi:uncharacterized protein YecE (DUF72 family)